MPEKWTVDLSTGAKLEVDNVETVELMNSDKHVRFDGAALAKRAFVNLEKTDIAYSDHVDVVYTPAP